MMLGQIEDGLDSSLLVKNKTGCGCHLCEETFTDNDHVPMKASRLSRPRPCVVSEHFTKSPGIVLRSFETSFDWWH
jgi:hypothetical protein